MKYYAVLVACLLLASATYATSHPASTSYPPLIQAVLKEDAGRVNLLIINGVDVDEETDMGKLPGETALMFAAQQGNLAIVKLLVQAGANVNRVALKTPWHAGHPVLWYALKSRSTEVVHYLLEAGAWPNVETSGSLMVKPDARTFSLLHYAISSKAPVALIRDLIKHGADVNAYDRSGCWTPLMVAAYLGLTDVIKELLKNGAQKALTNKGDLYKTAYDYAVQQRNKDCAALLK